MNYIFFCGFSRVTGIIADFFLKCNTLGTNGGVVGANDAARKNACVKPQAYRPDDLVFFALYLLPRRENDEQAEDIAFRIYVK